MPDSNIKNMKKKKERKFKPIQISWTNQKYSQVNISSAQLQRGAQQTCRVVFVNKHSTKSVLQLKS